MSNRIIDLINEEIATLRAEIEAAELAEGDDYWDDQLDESYGRLSDLEDELLRLDAQ